MNATELNTLITGNNDGLIMATGYELAIVKNGKIVEAGAEISNHAFNIIGDQFIDCFDKVVEIKKFNTPQHNYTTDDGVKIPHADKGATA